MHWRMRSHLSICAVPAYDIRTMWPRYSGFLAQPPVSRRSDGTSRRIDPATGSNRNWHLWRSLAIRFTAYPRNWVRVVPGASLQVFPSRRCSFAIIANFGRYRRPTIANHREFSGSSCFATFLRLDILLLSSLLFFALTAAVIPLRSGLRVFCFLGTSLESLGTLQQCRR